MRKDYTGVVINRLTVLEYKNRGKFPSGRTKWMWKCQCECGNICYLRTYEITKGVRKSCGCYMKDFNKTNNTLPNNLGAKKEILRQYKASAKKRNKSFTLTDAEFFNLLTENCEYCGSEPENSNNGKHTKGFKYNGVDRVDNTKGYSLDNCVPCCHKCNDSKKNYTLTDWYSWLNKIHQFQKEKGTFNDYP